MSLVSQPPTGREPARVFARPLRKSALSSRLNATRSSAGSHAIGRSPHMAPPSTTPTPPDLQAATCKYFTPQTDDEPPAQAVNRGDRDRSPELELQRWLDLSG
jgi:hypothetical protein